MDSKLYKLQDSSPTGSKSMRRSRQCSATPIYTERQNGRKNSLCILLEETINSISLRV